MIKLNRGQCPEELTPEVQSALTELYKQDKHKDVWNSPKIKESLKDALTSMSHELYAKVKQMLQMNGVWSDEFQKLEDEMEEIKLQMV